jgi:hypothetical protein
MAEGGWDGMGGGGFVRMFATLSSAGLASGVKLPHHVRAATFDACHIRWAVSRVLHRDVNTRLH